MKISEYIFSFWKDNFYKEYLVNFISYFGDLACKLLLECAVRILEAAAKDLQ